MFVEMARDAISLPKVRLFPFMLVPFLLQEKYV